MQRPFFSQSPKRVGSGPEGPPISMGGDGRVSVRGVEVCSSGAVAADAGRPTPWGSFCIAQKMMPEERSQDHPRAPELDAQSALQLFVFHRFFFTRTP